jgi:hypothetical protein
MNETTPNNDGEMVSFKAQMIVGALMVIAVVIYLLAYGPPPDSPPDFRIPSYVF